MIAARLANIPKHIHKSDSARKFKVNPHYISDAKKIRETSLELFEKVKDGKKTITQALERKEKKFY